MYKIFLISLILKLSFLNCSEIEIVTLHIPFEDKEIPELQLIEAIKQNNYETVKKLLKDKNIDLNFQDENGETPLIHASRCRDYRFTQLLIEKNVNPALVNKYNENAASAAFNHKNIKAARQLLNYEEEFAKKYVEPRKTFHKFIIYFSGKNDEEIKKNKLNFIKKDLFKKKLSFFEAKKLKRKKVLKKDDYVTYTDITDSNAVEIRVKESINYTSLSEKIPHLNKFKIKSVEIIYE